MNRILVVLPNWFGETLFATPFLRALRDQHPNAYIATLSWPQCRAVLENNPHVDEILEYDEKGKHRGLWQRYQIARMLRRQTFDTAFILRRSLSRTILMMASGIKGRIGFDNAKSGLFLSRRVSVEPHKGHKAATYLKLLDKDNPSAGDLRYEFFLDQKERDDASALLEKNRVRKGQPFVILHPGANWFHKRWPAERFAKLGDWLVQKYQIRVLVTGAPEDLMIGESINRRMEQPVLSLVGRTTPRQLAAILEKSRLLISNDTGIMHVAVALSRPAVALYGPTDPELTGPLGDAQKTVVIHHRDCCPSIPCYLPGHPELPGMHAITVEQVQEAVGSLLHISTAV